MPKYRFEIQKCITVIIESENEITARMTLVENPSLYQEEMTSDCYISDGIEVL